MPQDPAAIQRDIEVTRAELADTIDAITEKVSPKRVADRTKLALTERATELRDRVQSRNGHAPAALIPGPGDGGAVEPYGPPARSVRWDRVALVAGTVVLLLARRRRKRRKAAADAD